MECPAWTSSHALPDLEPSGRLRHSISFGDVEEPSAGDGGHHARRTSRGQMTTAAELDSRQACYTSSLLFKKSPARASGANHRLQAACEDVSTFPHLPGASDSACIAPGGDKASGEKSPISPSYLFFSRLLSFGPSWQSTTVDEFPAKEDHQPHPLTRSMSEAMLPSAGHKLSATAACRSQNMSRQHSQCNDAGPPLRSPGARAQSCAHPLTRCDLSESECSTPALSPRRPTAAPIQPSWYARTAPRHVWQEDTNLSVRTCEFSESQDSPVTSPHSSFHSFLSGFIPRMLSPDPFGHSGSIESNDTLAASLASTSSSVDSSVECFSRPVTPDPVAHRISQPAEYSPEDGTPPELTPVRTTVSLSTAFDVNMASWPLHTAALPRSCRVDSFCMMDEDVEQSANSFPGEVVDTQSPPETALPCAQTVDPPSPPEPASLCAKTDSLASAIQAEIAGVVCGLNTTPAVCEQIPDSLLVQLVGLLGTSPEIQVGHAEAVMAAVGPERLCGFAQHEASRFQCPQEFADKATGLTFVCDKMILRKHLHMYRTRFRIPNASVDTVQTFMLNDHVVRNSNASMLSYVRLEDLSLAESSEPSPSEPGPSEPAASHGGEDPATDSGFTYSKIKFPMIGPRQYCTARRVWHRPAGEGVYIVCIACQDADINAQARRLDDAKGLDKAWNTDFWTGQVIRPFEDDGVKGVEVASVTYDDMGVPAVLANRASVHGLWVGAMSFVDGFRKFESTVADCRASGEDIFSAMEDGKAQEAQEDGRGWRGVWGRRLRHAALLCVSGLVFKKLV